jgi:Tol biopolymer transport system component
LVFKEDPILNKLQNFSIRLLLVSLGLALLSVPTLFGQKLPATLAGTIPARPSGQIAFIRDGDVWIMDADGTNQQLVTQVKNADGRLSWAPDGRRIAFTRSGKVEWSDAMESSGGRKKIYDIFVAFLDSAKAGKTMWWHRISDELGGRDPEWSADGSKIYFTKDCNANRVNAEFLNYQICSMDPEGGNFTMLRKDWQNANEFLMGPTVSPTGDIAVTHLFGNKDAAKDAQSIRPQGMTILPHTNYMKSMDSLRLTTKKMAGCITPAWSPDGKWIAYVNTDAARSGVYIVAPDLATPYLVFSAPAGTAVYTIEPSFSPDSKWLTFSTNDGSIYICDITGNGLRKLTGPGSDKFPAWSKGASTAARSTTVLKKK